MRKKQTKQFVKRSAALMLSGCMAVGLSACGGKDSQTASNGKGSDDTEHYFKTTFVDSLPATAGNNMSGEGVIKNDTLYYGAYDDAYTNFGLYAYNILTGEEKTLWQSQSSSGNSQNVSCFDVSDNGNIYMTVQTGWIDTSNMTEDTSNATLDDVLNYMVQEWGYESTDAAQKDWDEYYASDYTDADGNPDYKQFLDNMYGEYKSKYSVQAYDADGNQIYDADLSELIGDNGNTSSILADADGNAYLSLESWGENDSSYFIEVLDKDGKDKGKIALDNWSDGLVMLSDGRIGVSSYGDTGREIDIIDKDTMALSDEKIEIGSDFKGIKDENTMYVSDGSSIYLYNVKTGDKEKYLTWVDCNILSSSVTSFGSLSDGRMAVLTRNWSNRTNQTETEVALIEEVDKSEIPESTKINVACLYIDSDLEERVIEFNKKSQDAKISIKSYFDDNMEYEDMVNNFTTAVASDKSIDMVVFDSYAQMANYASKGLLTDLYALMDGDSDVTKADFIPSVLSSCEFSGKLVALPQTFSINTVVGKTSDVGDTPGWTLDDVKALLASKEDGTQLFYGMTRSDILDFCLNLGYKEFINMEDATCSFDNEDFVDVLEFAAMFPENFEYEEDVDETVLLNTGKVLLSAYGISDFDQIQMYREIFGGELTYIGYPTNEGNGAMLNLSSLMGITENCSDKAATWSFMRQFYTAKSDEEIQQLYNFPVRQSDFDKFCENAMKEDENGGSSWGWGSFDVEIKPATQEDIDAVKDLLNNTTAVYGALTSDVKSIIEEDTAAFFAGQKSAQEVAESIQSRVQIYLSETK